MRAPGPHGRDPLADSEREDGRPYREPDEEQPEDVLPVAKVVEELVEHGDRGDRQGPAQPDRVRDPVDDGVDAADEAAERSRVQMYGPPSSVNAAPSSAVRNAYGMKKTNPRNISHVKPWAPLAATAPIVSRPTSVQIRKKNMSKRPKCLWSFAFSSTAADVVCSAGPWLTDILPLFRTNTGRATGGRPCRPPPDGGKVRGYRRG